MDKDHNKQFNKRRKSLKRKSEVLVRVEKRLEKCINKPELVQKRNTLVFDLQQERRRVCEQERKSVREMVNLERSVYVAVATGLHPVIMEEFSFLREVEQMGEALAKITEIIFNSSRDSDFRKHWASIIEERKQSFVFITPPSTPDGLTVSSRSCSSTSINSFSISSFSSRSIQEVTESLTSRTNSFSSQKVSK